MATWCGRCAQLVLVLIQRGKKVPEGLTPAEDISQFEQIASHPVGGGLRYEIVCTAEVTSY